MARKVLICDDERHILESVTYIVRQEGYQVLAAEDGAQALRVARDERPDLILLDILMPEKNGFEVCWALKSDPETRGIYVILLTALGQERDLEEGYHSGADEYITKPFSPRLLRRKLHELLDC